MPVQVQATTSLLPTSIAVQVDMIQQVTAADTVKVEEVIAAAAADIAAVAAQAVVAVAAAVAAAEDVVVKVIKWELNRWWAKNILFCHPNFIC